MINLLNERELAFGMLPNEPDSNQVVYVENHQNPELEEFIRRYKYAIEDVFKANGMEFIYLPDWLEEIDDEDFEKSARYFIPWLKKEDLKFLRQACKIRIDQISNSLAPRTDSPTIVSAQGKAYSVDVRPFEYELLFCQIAEACGDKRRHDAREKLYFEARMNPIPGRRLRPENPVHGIIREPIRESDSDRTSDRGQILYRMRDVSENESPNRAPSEIDHSLFEEDKELDRLYKQARQSIPNWILKAALANVLRDREVISRVEINSPDKILLPDYNNMEIELRPAEMALYILYLKHPEGIRFKELIDYRKELERIYNYTTIRTDEELNRQSIDAIVDSIEKGLSAE